MPTPARPSSPNAAPAATGTAAGPRLVGSGISVAAAKAQIDNGGTTMPANLVSGRDEDDVLAYLATILGK